MSISSHHSADLLDPTQPMPRQRILPIEVIADDITLLIMLGDRDEKRSDTIETRPYLHIVFTEGCIFVDSYVQNTLMKRFLVLDDVEGVLAVELKTILETIKEDE